MTNWAEVDKMKDAIRKAESLKRWKMFFWADGVVKPEAKDAWECGATYCGAGWVCAINGYLPAYVTYNGKPVAAAGSIFVPIGSERDINSTDFNWSSTINVEDFARKKLEITKAQAEVIFLDTSSMRDVEKYFAVVDYVLADENFDYEHAKDLINRSSSNG